MTWLSYAAASKPGAAALLGATALGAALALASIAQAPGPDIGDAAALVDGEPIARAEYQRAMEALAKDKRNPLSPADEARILDRLIEEELLVRRAVEIGLIKSDRAVRSAMVNAMIQQAVAPVSALATDEAELRAWFAKNRDLFRPQPSLRVATFGAATDLKTILAIGEAIESGESFEAIAARFQSGRAVAAPDALLPLSKLKDYLGGDAADRLAKQPEGGWAGPFRMGELGVFHHVRERLDHPPPTFAKARSQIEAAYRRSKEEEAFRSYLDWLKSRAKIQRLSSGEAQ